MNYNNHLGEQITKKTFYNEYLPVTIKYYIYMGVCILFLAALVNGVQLLINPYPYLLIHILILLGLGFATLLFKSRISSVLTLIYFVVIVILGLLEGRIAVGILPLVAVISSAVGTFRYHKFWKIFNENPQLYSEIRREYIVKEDKQNALRKNGKKVLIILPIVLVAFIALLLILTQFADDALSFKGELTNNVYKNKYTNISVTIPDNYTVASEEKKEEDLGTSDETILYDLYGYNEEMNSDFEIDYENSDYAESDYLEQLKKVYNGYDYTYSFDEIQTVIFAGEQYEMLNMRIGDSPLYIRYYANEFEEGYMTVITISAFDASEVDRLAACFDSMK